MTPPSKLIILNFALHVGEVGIAYAPITLGGSGGTPPYKWSIGGGALPAGLTINANTGAISGTPTAAGGFNFVVLLQDSAGQAAGVARSVTVVPYLTASGLCTKLCNVEVGCNTFCGGYTDVAGGVTPFSYQLAQGFLPAGTSLGQALGGIFAGADCSNPCPYTFTVSITDALGAKASVVSTFDVYDHIFFQGGTIPVNANSPCFFPGCTATFNYFGGVGNVTATVTGWNPPAGWVPPSGCKTPTPCNPAQPTVSAQPSVSAPGGIVTVSVPSPGWTGTISGYTGWVLTVVLTDSSPCGAGPVNCSSTPAPITITVLGG
ncbi:MAG TPA: Ig domain-containing protein [Candidatus Dormibacteraeota bacterium]|nr:Ig domain-containing protein [Candidatus Dormibacteraeota bacterium]